MKQVDFSAAMHLAFHEFKLCDLSLAWRFAQGLSMSARTAALSSMAPRAKKAIKLFLASSIHGSRDAASFFRSMAWKRSMSARASTSLATLYR